MDLFNSITESSMQAEVFPPGEGDTASIFADLLDQVFFGSTATEEQLGGSLFRVDRLGVSDAGDFDNVVHEMGDRTISTGISIVHPKTGEKLCNTSLRFTGSSHTSDSSDSTLLDTVEMDFSISLSGEHTAVLPILAFSEGDNDELSVTYEGYVLGALNSDSEQAFPCPYLEGFGVGVFDNEESVIMDSLVFDICYPNGSPYMNIALSAIVDLEINLLHVYYSFAASSAEEPKFDARWNDSEQYWRNSFTMKGGMEVPVSSGLFGIVDGIFDS